MDALKTIGGLVARNMLAGIGGALAAKGVISPSEVGPFVEIGAGLITALISAVWSLSQKKRSGAL